MATDCSRRGSGGTSGELLPNGRALVKARLAAPPRGHLPEATCFRIFTDPATSPSSAVCSRGGGIKLGRGLLQGLEGCLDSAPRLSSQRMSPGVVKGGEDLRGLQGSPPWAAPRRLGQWGRLLGRQGQGSPLGGCWFPVDADCHLLSHRSWQHLGFFRQDTQAGAAAQRALAHSSWSMLSVPKDRELPQRLVTSVGSTLEISREPVHGAACTGTARVFPWRPP